MKLPYSKLPNAVIESLMKASVRGPALRLTLAVARRTFGWNKSEDMISVGQFTELTGLDARSVRRGLSEALGEGLIEEGRPGTVLTPGGPQEVRSWRVGRSLFDPQLDLFKGEGGNGPPSGTERGGRKRSKGGGKNGPKGRAETAPYKRKGIRKLKGEEMQAALKHWKNGPVSAGAVALPDPKVEERAIARVARYTPEVPGVGVLCVYTDFWEVPVSGPEEKAPHPLFYVFNRYEVALRSDRYFAPRLTLPEFVAGRGGKWLGVFSDERWSDLVKRRDPPSWVRKRILELAGVVADDGARYTEEEFVERIIALAEGQNLELDPWEVKAVITVDGREGERGHG